MILEGLRTNPSFKGALTISMLDVLYINQIRSKSSQYKICKEVVSTNPVVIYTRKNFYLIDALNNKIEQLKSAGLVEFWQLKHIDQKLLNFKESSEPIVLVMVHLIGCFCLLVTGCAASFVVFLFELC